MSKNPEIDSTSGISDIGISYTRSLSTTNTEYISSLLGVSGIDKDIVAIDICHMCNMRSKRLQRFSVHPLPIAFVQEFFINTLKQPPVAVISRHLAGKCISAGKRTEPLKGGFIG